MYVLWNIEIINTECSLNKQRFFFKKIERMQLSSVGTGRYPKSDLENRECNGVVANVFQKFDIRVVVPGISWQMGSSQV